MNFHRTLIAVLCLVCAIIAKAETVEPSGTLPICYVNTQDNAPIVDKENYLNAEMWIVPPEGSDIEAFGSEENPVTLQIRGRGNSSWTYDKKPYRVKFDKKQEPFGFPKSKHFALLAHAPTQIYLNNETSFELARLIGVDYVPNTYPVEVVLNGEYLGVYSFSETIKADKNRIDIDEQPDNNTDEATIPYGWLVEIDNTLDTPQICVDQCYGEATPDTPFARFTMKTPEVLSELQEQWITDQMTRITRAIYNPDKSNDEWTEYIDIESLAKYYIVQELSCNQDAFIGSTYMHKGNGDKWSFGSIWDSDWTWSPEKRGAFFFDEPIRDDSPQFTWVRELLKFPKFYDEVLRVWDNFYPSEYEKLDGYVDSFYNLCKDGYIANAQRWPQYNEIPFENCYYYMKRRVKNYPVWFDTFVRTTMKYYVSGIGSVEADTASDGKVYDITGRYVGRDLSNLPKGVYICGGKKIMVK